MSEVRLSLVEKPKVIDELMRALPFLDSSLTRILDETEPDGDFELQSLFVYYYNLLELLVREQTGLVSVYETLTIPATHKFNSFRAAHALIKLLTASENDHGRSVILQLCDDYLRREWLVGVWAKGFERSTYNHTVFAVLRTRVCLFGERDLDELDNLITRECSTCFIATSIASQSPLLTSTATNAAASTRRTIFETLLSCLIDAMAQSTSANSHSDLSLYILHWTRLVQMYSSLIMACKNCPNADFQRTLVRSLFKHSYVNQCVHCFLKIMPAIQGELSLGPGDRRQNTINLLKSIQPSNRYIQHVCSLLKLKSLDTNASKCIPTLRTDLEKIIYQVQKMLRKNGLQDAFSCGQLKNRDLQGNEIASQVYDLDENVEPAMDMELSEDFPELQSASDECESQQD